MITIRKIAELAGVSRGTVDRVINKRGGVSKFAEQRVSDIVKRYGFKPNKVARALVKSKKLYTIGVVSATLDNVFFRDVVRGIRRAESELADLGFSVDYREVARFSVPDQIAAIDAMLERGIDALAINPINDDVVRAKLAEIAGLGIPVVTFNSDIEGVERLAYIGCDYRRSGRIAAGLLAMASREPREIAIVTGSRKSLGHCLRVEGFSEEIERHPGMRVADVVEMFDDDVTSYARVRGLLEKNAGIDAFFFCAAGKAGGIRAIADLRPRGETIIVTVDMDDFTRECLLDGTVVATVCQQPYVQGYDPLWQLANYLMHGDRPPQVQFTQAEIVIRQSVN